MDRLAAAHIKPSSANAQPVRFFPRAATAEEWAARNPVLFRGEEGLEIDTGKRKLGDGVTLWSLLPYLPTPSTGGGGGPVQGVAETYETIAKNLRGAAASFNYVGGRLESIDYANGITKTFVYTGDDLAEVVLSGDTPDGIDLTKAFTYSAGGDLAAISYE